MRTRHLASRPAFPLLTSVLGLFVLMSGLAVAAPAAVASTGAGWIRLAHFSPNTPAVDVYLYPFGNSQAMVVLKHVSYGTVSPYEKVQAGEYTVAMRAAGASASASPVLSTNVRVSPGADYTVAGMGPRSGLRLKVLTDKVTTPAGRSLVRVIQASLREHRVTVAAGSRVLARDLAFTRVSPYLATPPGTWTVRATGVDGRTTQRVRLAAGTIHTLVVLDGSTGLKLADLEDAAGSAVMPRGGAATGMGGTAPVPGSSPAPWAGLVAAGALGVAAGAFRLWRPRNAPRRAR